MSQRDYARARGRGRGRGFNFQTPHTHTQQGHGEVDKRSETYSHSSVDLRQKLQNSRVERKRYNHVGESYERDTSSHGRYSDRSGDHSYRVTRPSDGDIGVSHEEYNDQMPVEEYKHHRQSYDRPGSEHDTGRHSSRDRYKEYDDRMPADQYEHHIHSYDKHEDRYSSRRAGYTEYDDPTSPDKNRGKRQTYTGQGSENKTERHSSRRDRYKEFDGALSADTYEYPGHFYDRQESENEMDKHSSRRNMYIEYNDEMPVDKYDQSYKRHDYEDKKDRHSSQRDRYFEYNDQTPADKYEYSYKRHDSENEKNRHSSGRGKPDGYCITKETSHSTRSDKRHDHTKTASSWRKSDNKSKSSIRNESSKRNIKTDTNLDDRASPSAAVDDRPHEDDILYILADDNRFDEESERLFGAGAVSSTSVVDIDKCSKEMKHLVKDYKTNLDDPFDTRIQAAANGPFLPDEPSTLPPTENSNTRSTSIDHHSDKGHSNIKQTQRHSGETIGHGKRSKEESGVTNRDTSSDSTNKSCVTKNEKLSRIDNKRNSSVIQKTGYGGPKMERSINDKKTIYGVNAKITCIKYGQSSTRKDKSNTYTSRDSSIKSKTESANHHSTNRYKETDSKPLLQKKTRQPYKKEYASKRITDKYFARRNKFSNQNQNIKKDINYNTGITEPSSSRTHGESETVYITNNVMHSADRGNGEHNKHMPDDVREYDTDKNDHYGVTSYDRTSDNKNNDVFKNVVKHNQGFSRHEKYPKFRKDYTVRSLGLRQYDRVRKKYFGKGLNNNINRFSRSNNNSRFAQNRNVEARNTAKPREKYDTVSDTKSEFGTNAVGNFIDDPPLQMSHTFVAPEPNQQIIFLPNPDLQNANTQGMDQLGNIILNPEFLAQKGNNQSMPVQIDNSSVPPPPPGTEYVFIPFVNQGPGMLENVSIDHVIPPTMDVNLPNTQKTSTEAATSNTELQNPHDHRGIGRKFPMSPKKRNMMKQKLLMKKKLQFEKKVEEGVLKKIRDRKAVQRSGRTSPLRGETLRRIESNTTAHKRKQGYTKRKDRKYDDISDFEDVSEDEDKYEKVSDLEDVSDEDDGGLQFADSRKKGFRKTKGIKSTIKEGSYVVGKQNMDRHATKFSNPNQRVLKIKRNIKQEVADVRKVVDTSDGQSPMKKMRINVLPVHDSDPEMSRESTSMLSLQAHKSPDRRQLVYEKRPISPLHITVKNDHYTKNEETKEKHKYNKPESHDDKEYFNINKPRNYEQRDGFADSHQADDYIQEISIENDRHTKKHSPGHNQTRDEQWRYESNEHHGNSVRDTIQHREAYTTDEQYRNERREYENDNMRRQDRKSLAGHSYSTKYKANINKNAHFKTEKEGDIRTSTRYNEDMEFENDKARHRYWDGRRGDDMQRASSSQGYPEDNDNPRMGYRNDRVFDDSGREMDMFRHTSNVDRDRARYEEIREHTDTGMDINIYRDERLYEDDRPNEKEQGDNNFTGGKKHHQKQFDKGKATAETTHQKDISKERHAGNINMKPSETIDYHHGHPITAPQQHPSVIPRNNPPGQTNSQLADFQTQQATNPTQTSQFTAVNASTALTVLAYDRSEKSQTFFDPGLPPSLAERTSRTPDMNIAPDMSLPPPPMPGSGLLGQPQFLIQQQPLQNILTSPLMLQQQNTIQNLVSQQFQSSPMVQLQQQLLAQLQSPQQQLMMASMNQRALGQQTFVTPQQQHNMIGQSQLPGNSVGMQQLVSQQQQQPNNRQMIQQQQTPRLQNVHQIQRQQNVQQMLNQQSTNIQNNPTIQSQGVVNQQVGQQPLSLNQHQSDNPQRFQQVKQMLKTELVAPQSESRSRVVGSVNMAKSGANVGSTVFAVTRQNVVSSSQTKPRPHLLPTPQTGGVIGRASANAIKTVTGGALVQLPKGTRQYAAKGSVLASTSGATNSPPATIIKAPVLYDNNKLGTSMPKSLYKTSGENTSQMKCSRCNHQFVNVPLFKRHIRWHDHRNRNVKDLRCDDCQQAFPTASLLMEHVSERHSGNTYSCASCDAMFPALYELFKHTKSSGHHTNVKAQYLCSHCKAPFPTHDALVNHRKSRHPDGKVYTVRPFN